MIFTGKITMKTITDCAIHVNIEVCKNKCIFCRAEEYELKKTDHSVLVKDMYRQAINLRKRGFENPEISGHDPIEYENISEYISWLKKIGFKNVTLATHGRNLSDIETSKKIIASGLDCLRIPIYGSTAEIHDAVTGSSGSFEETMNGLRNVADSGIEICIVTLILDDNLVDMKNIADIAASFNADLHIIRAGISNNTIAKHLVRYNDLKRYLPELYLHCKAILDNKFYFFDYAYCLFGFRQDEIVFTGVPEMSEDYSVPSTFQTEKKNIPDYRLMIKMDFCKNCCHSSSCVGFNKKQVLMFEKPSEKIIPEDFLL